MSYPKNIVPVRPTRGVSVDIPPNAVSPEFYTRADNFNFHDGFAERTTGETAVYSPISSNLRNIINIQTNAGANYWVYSGEDTVYARTSATDTDISFGGISTVASPDDFTTDSLNGLLTWNNAVDEPKYWDLDTGTNLVSLPGWVSGDQCKALRAFKYHLFALSMTESVAGDLPMKLKWSHAAEPGAMPTTWVPAATNEAGDTQLSDTDGPIVDALSLRSSFIIYKHGSTYICDYIGGQFVFSFRKLFSSFGVLARNCVHEHNGKHYVFGSDDIIIHDGNQFRTLVDGRIRSAIFDNLDQDNFANAFVVHYERHGEMWFCYPESGSTYCNQAAIYHIDEDTWGFRDLNLAAHGATGIVSDSTPDSSWTGRVGTWAAQSTPWNEQLYSNAVNDMVYGSTDEATPTSSLLLQVDTGTDFNGTDIQADLQKLEMSFDSPDRVKFVKRIYPKIVASTGTTVQIRAGGSDFPGGPITWGVTVNFVVGTDFKADLFAVGKYISFEASSIGGAPWTMTGFDVEVEMRGYF